MEYRHVGRSGLRASTVGLGTNNFGGRMDAERSATVVYKALDLGINFIDTSDSYGNGLSEEYIGKALKGLRHQVVLATKFFAPTGDGANDRGASRKHIKDAVERSLRLLNTDYIDLYQLHRPDVDTPIEETLSALDDLVRQGKVLYIGSSNLRGWMLADAVWTARSLHLASFISAQNQYNMLERNTERDVIPCCEHFGLGVIPFYPLASGFLTGKYRRGEPAPEGTRLAGNRNAQQTYFTDRNFTIVEGLERFAREQGHTVGELAIAWLLAQPMVCSVIAGATAPEQVVANAAATDWRLSADDLVQIRRILELDRVG